jgi:hypothetical protein
LALAVLLVIKQLKVRSLCIMNKAIVIATDLMAAALTGLVSTQPMAAYAFDGGDES